MESQLHGKPGPWPGLHLFCCIVPDHPSRSIYKVASTSNIIIGFSLLFLHAPLLQLINSPRPLLPLITVPFTRITDNKILNPQIVSRHRR